MFSSKIINVIGLTLISIILSPFALSKTDNQIDTSMWTMYQGNAEHTGYVPIEINEKKITQKWQIEIGELYNTYPAAIIGKNYIFTVKQRCSDVLRASSLEDGSQIWSVEFESGHELIQPPAYDNGKVIIQTISHKARATALSAYDEENGELLYRTPFIAQWPKYNAPIVDKGIIYACTGYGSGLSAFNTENGDKIWSNETFYSSSDNTTPAINSKYLVFYNAGVLYIIDRATGNITADIHDVHWEWMWDNDPTPILSDDHSVIITYNNYLTKYNLDIKTVDFTIENVTSNAAVDTKNIYFIKNARLTAIDKNTGEYRWQLDSDTSLEELEDILITKNLLFISNSEGTTAYFKGKGSKALWHTTIHGKMSLSDKGLFIVSNDGKVTAFNVH